MVDRIVGAGLRLARLSSPTRAELGELLLPPQADNPVDLGGRLPTQPDDIAAPALRALAADPDVGVLLLYLTSMPVFEARTRTLAQAALASGKPVLAVMLPGPAAERAARGVARAWTARISIRSRTCLRRCAGCSTITAWRRPPDAPQRPADLPTTLPPLE